MSVTVNKKQYVYSELYICRIFPTFARGRLAMGEFDEIEKENNPSFKMYHKQSQICLNQTKPRSWDYLPGECHHTNRALSITITSYWALQRLKSPASPLFSQLLVRAQIKENVKVPRHWPLCGEFTGERWIPRTKGQQHGKCFHLMTSSCSI